jgi:hypothetical protein
MKVASTVSTDPIDELCQIRDELRVVWLALGNDTDQGYLPAVREHVNGIANRVHDIVEQMSSDALDAMAAVSSARTQRMTGGQRNG